MSLPFLSTRVRLAIIGGLLSFGVAESLNASPNASPNLPQNASPNAFSNAFSNASPDASPFYIGTRCSADPVYIGESGPLTCSSPGSKAEISTSVQYFSNGFVASIVEHGSLDSTNGISSAFTAWVHLPFDFSVAGSNRPILVKTISLRSETVTSSPGTVGTYYYGGAGGKVLVTTRLTGDGQGADWNYPTSTIGQDMSGDLSSTGYVLVLSGSIATGQAYGSAEVMLNVQFFELDGVTPAAISPRKNTGKTTNQGNGPKKKLLATE